MDGSARNVPGEHVLEVLDRVDGADFAHARGDNVLQ
jgi:hypothetical protein